MSNFNTAPIEARIDQLKGVEDFRDFAGMLKRSSIGFEPIHELIELPDKVRCVTDAIVSIRTSSTDGQSTDRRAYDLWYDVMLKSLDEAIWPNERFRQQVAAVLNGNDPDSQSQDTYWDMLTTLQDAVSRHLMDELWAIR